MSTDFEQVRYEKSEGIATITLNRPERMNAFTPRMLDEWLAALQDAHLDPETRVIILTAKGRGFCTGMDVQAQAQGQGLLPLSRSWARPATTSAIPCSASPAWSPSSISRTSPP